MVIDTHFDGKEVLVTGATGLMGKALVEKLLRSCPGVSKIYVVIRAKRGRDPGDRWLAVTQSHLFDYLRANDPNSLAKVEVVHGDGTENEFGFSEEDQKMLIEKVNIVFHGAASINFFNNITQSLKANLKSTHSLLELAKKMKRLERFVHISTAYANFNVRGVIKEEIYESHLDWRTMIQLIQDDKQGEALTALEPVLMNGHLSTYTLTKAMAENAVRDYSQFFPTIIIRPALVNSTAKEPVAGWLDMDNFITLYCRGVRMGVLHVTPLSANTAIEVIPLDLAVRGMIVATWKQSVEELYDPSSSPKQRTDVYCQRMKDEFRPVIGDLEFLRDYNDRIPAVDTIWYTFYFHITNPVLYAIVFFFLHLIPGFVIDAALTLSGRTPRMKKIYTTILRYNPLSRYYINPHNSFDDVNFKQLENIVPDEDMGDFSLDYSDYDKKKALVETFNCVVKHVWKEQIDDEVVMEKARNRYRRLTILHYSLCVLGLSYFAWTIWTFSRLWTGP